MKRLIGPLVVLVALTYLMAIWFFEIDHGAWRTHHLVGATLTAGAFVLWTIARIQLGDALTWSARAHSLVRHGLYSRIRNPIYLFAGLVWIGLLVFIGRPLFFLTLAISLPMQVRRARRESKVLEAAFGEDYRAYRAVTWL
ncbi:MAG TPA: isoprenylcysteine carboxylmethyltransferase family protein [Gemmatimonadaceae bacterium]|nr:isoprenylcysteine carboxylmethyltransferase family protein [Gemmatimonadaceae bacterium]